METLRGSRLLGRVRGQVSTRMSTSLRPSQKLTNLQVSGSLHLHSQEPLFKRYVSMSGTSLMMKPLPPPVSEFAYSYAIEFFGLKDLSASERINALLELPVEKLLSVPPNIPFLPITDGDLIPGAATFAQISSPEDPNSHMVGRNWCKDLLIGDCQFDVCSPASQPLVFRITNMTYRVLSYHSCLVLAQPILPNLSAPLLTSPWRTTQGLQRDFDMLIISLQIWPIR